MVVSPSISVRKTTAFVTMVAGVAMGISAMPVVIMFIPSGASRVVVRSSGRTMANRLFV
jgi:hypothetical protein